MEELTKQQYRLKYKDLRKELSTNALNSLETKINSKLIEMVNGNVHVYLPILKNIEVNIWPFINHSFNKNTIVGTSIYNKSVIKHVKISKSTIYSKGEFNIPTPTNAEETNLLDFNYIIVPLMAYDKTGNRIGYGKGIYDSILKKCKDDCIKIGVSHFNAEQKVPFETHDIKLDYCINSIGTLKF